MRVPAHNCACFDNVKACIRRGRQANKTTSKHAQLCAGSEVLREPGAIRDNTSFLSSSSFLARATSKVDLRTVNVCSDTCCDARGCHVRLFILFLSCSPRIARPSPLSSCPLRAVPGCTLLSVRCMPRISLSTCFSSSASSCFLTCGCERVCLSVSVSVSVSVCACMHVWMRDHIPIQKRSSYPPPPSTSVALP